MEKKNLNRNLTAQNYFCICCAMEEGVYAEADHFVWNEHEQILYPVCSGCKAIMEEENIFFRCFSKN